MILFHFRENQMLTWKAYSVGSGNIHSENDLKKLWKSEISSTEIIVHSAKNGARQHNYKEAGFS